jgi:hypothetical protein
VRSAKDAELLSQRRGITRRAGSEAARTGMIESEFDVTVETGEFGTLQIAAKSFHRSRVPYW